MFCFNQSFFFILIFSVLIWSKYLTEFRSVFVFLLIVQQLFRQINDKQRYSPYDLDYNMLISPDSLIEYTFIPTDASLGAFPLLGIINHFLLSTSCSCR